VRDTIKSFAKQQVRLPPGRHKIVILDEVDNMTGAAQQALRRIMEEFSSTTRFALACNYSTKIIEAIQSRCAILRFTKLSDEELLLRLKQICQKENVTCTDDGYEAILFTANGDMRQAINNLQSTHSGFSIVNAENVFKVCDQPHPAVLQKIVNDCQNGKIREAQKEMKRVLWDKGYSGMDILASLFKVVKNHSSLPEYCKLEFLKEIGFAHKRALEGCESLVQLTGLLAKMCKIANEAKA